MNASRRHCLRGASISLAHSAGISFAVLLMPLTAGSILYSGGATASGPPEVNERKWLPGEPEKEWNAAHHWQRRANRLEKSRVPAGYSGHFSDSAGRWFSDSAGRWFSDERDGKKLFVPHNAWAGQDAKALRIEATRITGCRPGSERSYRERFDPAPTRRR